jgi:kojibiose phosphorylase
MWAVGLGPVERVGNAHVVLSGLDDIHWAELLSRLVKVGSTRKGI